MQYKANFKYLILSHIIGIISLLVCIFFVDAAQAVILKWIAGALLISIVIQWLLFRLRPSWFKNKVKDYPNS
jgi:uncharacterized membrane protein YfcA